MITFMGYLMPKLPLSKNDSGTIKPTVWGVETVHSFLMIIIPKVNVIPRLESELAFYDVTV